MPADTRTKRRKWTKTILYLMGNHLRHCLVEFSTSLSLDGAAPVRSTEVGVVDLAMVVLLPRFVARVRIRFTAEKRPPGQAKKQTWLYDCYGLRRHVLDGYDSILSSTGSANPPLLRRERSTHARTHHLIDAFFWSTAQSSSLSSMTWRMTGTLEAVFFWSRLFLHFGFFFSFGAMLATDRNLSPVV